MQTMIFRIGLLALFVLNCVACAGGKEMAMNDTPRQWRVAEFTLTAEGSYANPVADVELTAIFEGPGDARFSVPGFWDGGNTWKVRFTPTAPGRWSYTTTSNQTADQGLHGRKGRFMAAQAEGENPLYRHGGLLKVSENRRYLTYSDGTPFFWLGDTWWFCPSALVPWEGSTHPNYPSMYKALIDTRREQGYTIAHMAFLGPMAQSRGVNSFAELGALRTIEPTYWQMVDQYINYANDAGIIPVIGLSFHSGMDALTLEQWQFLWRYVIARYGAHAVTWLICGEYNADTGRPAERVPKVLELGQFIKDHDPYKRAMTVHPWWFGGDKRQAWDQPWYDFIMLQGAHQANPPASLYTEAYNRSTPKPVLEGECNYEGIKGMTDDDVRRAAYRAIQAGSFGYTYGAQGLWYPTQNERDQTFKEWGAIIPWWEALAQPGGAQMRYLRACYESLEWWKLEPRPDAVVMPASWPELLRVLVKADGDQTWVVYFPKGLPRDFTVKLQGLAEDASYAATWFDPRTGATSEAGVLSSDAPLPERPGAEDWLLILRKS